MISGGTSESLAERLAEYIRRFSFYWYFSPMETKKPSLTTPAMHHILRIGTTSALLILSLFSLSLASAQTKIGQGTYLYGEPERISGKVLVKFEDVPTLTEVKILKELRKTCDATNLTELLRGTSGKSEEELRDFVINKGFNHMIVFREEDSRSIDVSKSKSTERKALSLFSITGMSSKERSSGTSSEILAMLEMSMSFYDLQEDLEIPTFFIKAKVDVGGYITPKVAKTAVGQENRTGLSIRLLSRILKYTEKYLA